MLLICFAHMSYDVGQGSGGYSRFSWISTTRVRIIGTLAPKNDTCCTGATMKYTIILKRALPVSILGTKMISAFPATGCLISLSLAASSDTALIKATVQKPDRQKSHLALLEISEASILLGMLFMGDSVPERTATFGFLFPSKRARSIAF